MDEIWKPIPGYAGIYEASNLGQVRSLDRESTDRRGRVLRFKGRVIQPSTGRWGHKRVVLYDPPRKAKTITVHRAVMLSFTADRTDEGLVVCHQNGDASDNRLENLRWGTLSSNSRDMERHGTNAYRNRTHCPHGHLLEHPNLVNGKSSRGLRSCRSCHQARSDVREGSILSFQQLSDMRYEMNLLGRRFYTRQRKNWEPSYVSSGFDRRMLEDLPRSRNS